MFLMSWSAIILLSTCVFGVANGMRLDDDEFKKLDQLIKSPGFPDLMDIEVRPINLGVTLRKLIKSDISRWFADQGDLKYISNVAFTALCCKYSGVLYDFIEVVDVVLRKCQEADNEHSGSEFYTCSLEVKEILESHKVAASAILDAVLSYPRTFNVSVNRNFLNTLVSVNMYLHADNVYNPVAEVRATSERSVNEVVNILGRTNVYIKKRLEAYTIESCNPLTYEKSESVKLMEAECRESVHGGSSDMAKCLANEVGTSVFSKLDQVSQLIFDKLGYAFDPKSLLLTDLLEVEIVKGKEHTKLKCLQVKWRQQDTDVQQVYLNVSTDYRSESLIKYQLLMVDCIASVAFSLIMAIVTLEDDCRTANAKFSHILDKLGSFKFPGPLNAALQEMEYNRMYYSGKENVVISIKNYFKSSNFDFATLCKLLFGGVIIRETTNKEQAMYVLNGFVGQIENMKPYISAAMEMNEKLCGYDLEDVGFVQYAPKSELNTEQPDNSDCLNCKFALRLKTHLLSSDRLLLTCIGSVDTIQIPNGLESIDSCVGIVKRNIQEVEYYVRNSFLAAFKNLHGGSRVNRKLIDAFYSFMLYLNSDLFDVTNVGLQDKPNEALLAGLAELRRGLYLITNCLDQFTADHCALELSQTTQVEELQGILNRERANDPSGTSITLGSEDTIFPEFEDLMMDNTLAMMSLSDYYDSQAKELTVVWGKQSLTLSRLHDSFKRIVHWKYLSKYQSAVINVIVCTVYDKLAKILDAIVATDTTSVTPPYWKIIDGSLKCLDTVKFSRAHF